MEILNEVFLALAGFVGGLIVADDDDRKGEIFSYYSYFTLPFSDRENIRITGIASHKVHEFKVKDGTDKIDDVGRQQINQIAPLGWYYLRLNEYVSRNDISWGIDSEYLLNQSHEAGKLQLRSPLKCVYNTAVACSIKSLLEEYLKDVVNLEALVLESGPIPLSNLAHYFQKVVSLLIAKSLEYCLI